MKNIGLHADRLKPNRDNPREVAFVQQWHEEDKCQDILSSLLRVPCSRDDPDRIAVLLRDSIGSDFYKCPIGEATERDRIVVETVIQWLGSNCGMGFLREALNKSGYKVERMDKED